MTDTKTVSISEQIELGGWREVLVFYRDWILGGHNFEWKIFKEPNGDILLERW